VSSNTGGLPFKAGSPAPDLRSKRSKNPLNVSTDVLRKDDLVSVREASTLLGKSSSTLYRRAKAYPESVVREGRRVWFRRAAVHGLETGNRSSDSKPEITNNAAPMPSVSEEQVRLPRRPPWQGEILFLWPI
jgi:hypothetical protein